MNKGHTHRIYSLHSGRLWLSTSCNNCKNERKNENTADEGTTKERTWQRTHVLCIHETWRIHLDLHETINISNFSVSSGNCFKGKSSLSLHTPCFTCNLISKKIGESFGKEKKIPHFFPSFSSYIFSVHFLCHLPFSHRTNKPINEVVHLTTKRHRNYLTKLIAAKNCIN